MTFGSSWSRLDLTVNQSDDPTVPTQAFKQRNLIHISAHRFRICLVKGDAFNSIYLVRIVHYAVNARRAALADQIEPRVRLLAHNEVACLHLYDGCVGHVIFACGRDRIRRGAAPVSYGSNWSARGRGLGQLG